MEVFECQMCHLLFDVPEKEPKQKLKCPRCGSPDVKKTIDKLSGIFSNLPCGTNKKTA